MGSDNTNNQTNANSYIVVDNFVISNNGTPVSTFNEKSFSTNKVDDAIKGLSDAQTLLVSISDNLKKIDIPRQCGFYGDAINVFEDIINPNYSGKTKLDMSHDLTYIANLIKNYEDGMIDDETNNSNLIRDINVTRISGNKSSSFDVEVEGDFSAAAALTGIPTGGNATIGSVGSNFQGIDSANLAIAYDPVSGGNNAFYKATDASVDSKPEDGEFVIGQTPAQAARRGNFQYSTASYEAPVEEAPPVVETPPVTTPPATEPPFTFEDTTNNSDTNTVSQDPFGNGVSNYSTEDGDFDNGLAANNGGVATEYQEEETSGGGNNLKLAGGIALASGLALGSVAAVTAAKNNKKLKNGEDDDDDGEAYQYRKFM